jgi:hypothetical protein
LIQKIFDKIKNKKKKLKVLLIRKLSEMGTVWLIPVILATLGGGNQEVNSSRPAEAKSV